MRNVAPRADAGLEHHGPGRNAEPCDLEARVLERLDPPLNLDGMPPTPLRLRLRELRAIITRGPEAG